jgi:hypothetical protein
MVKFRWVPNSPENETKFLLEMRKEYDITESSVDKIQKELLAKSSNPDKLSKFLSNNIVPALASLKIKLSFGKSKRIEGQEKKLICYVCDLKVTPPHLEFAVKETAIRLGVGNFFSLIGFNYGKVEFFK